MTVRVAKVVLVLLVLGVAGCDQGTKRWVEHDLSGRPPTTLVRGTLDLEYAQNPGVAFSLERQLPEGARTPLVIVVGLGMISLIGLAIWKRRDRVSAESVGYALVLGGAAGNFVDRLARGYVVDFVHLHGWPVFNVADCAIVAGVALLFVGSISRSSA